MSSSKHLPLYGGSKKESDQQSMVESAETIYPSNATHGNFGELNGNAVDIDGTYIHT